MSDAYGPRLLRAIGDQMEARGIPAEEMPAVLGGIAKAYGHDDITQLHGGDLRRVQQHMDKHMRDHLGGAKRAPGVGGTAWPEGVTSSDMVAAAQAGMNISTEAADAEADA